MKSVKEFLKWIIAFTAIALLKTIKNYFQDKHNKKFKDLLLKEGFHLSIVNNPTILFTDYSSKNIIYFNFWAKIALKLFFRSIKTDCWSSKKGSRMLETLGFRQAYIYNTDFFINKYAEITIPENVPILEKVVIYSVMIGDYDEVVDPVYVSDNCDYVLFTDDANLKTKVWEIRLIQPNKNYSDKWNVCYYKFLAHKVLSEQYNYSIYVDAKVFICGDIVRLFQYLNPNCHLAFAKHFARHSLMEEINACVGANKVKKEEAMRQYEDYTKKEGFPDNLGLIESCVLIRKHTNTNVQKVMETWFDEFTKYPTRDQFSIMYSIWKSAMSDYCIIDEDICNSRFMITRPTHKKEDV